MLGGGRARGGETLAGRCGVGIQHRGHRDRREDRDGAKAGLGYFQRSPAGRGTAAVEDKR
jgi:hypothetical protein